MNAHSLPRMPLGMARVGMIFTTAAWVLSGAAVTAADTANHSKRQITLGETQFVSHGKLAPGAAELHGDLSAVIRINGEYIGDEPYAGPRRIEARLDTSSPDKSEQEIDLGALTGYSKLGILKVQYLIAERGRKKTHVSRRPRGGRVDLEIDQKEIAADAFVFKGRTFAELCPLIDGRPISRTLIQIQKIDPALSIDVRKLTHSHVATITLDKIALEALNRIELPTWSRYGQADRYDQEKWNSFELRTKAQELVRAEINARYAKSVAEALAKLKIVAVADTASGAKHLAMVEYRRQFKAIFARAQDELTKAHAHFSKAVGPVNCH